MQTRRTAPVKPAEQKPQRKTKKRTTPAQVTPAEQKRIDELRRKVQISNQAGLMPDGVEIRA